MEFYGPHRELLTRIYQRCVDRGWFGPEAEAPGERKVEEREKVFMGHLSEDSIRSIAPYLSQISYHYDTRRGGIHITVVKCSDVRSHRFFYPPASSEQITQTESLFGFTLPEMLLDIYSQLANGGFGFWCGFYGIIGGAEWNGVPIFEDHVIRNSWKLIDYAPDGLSEKKETLYCINLPDRFIPWAEWGCGIYSWIDGWTGRVYQSGYCLCSVNAIEEARQLKKELYGEDITGAIENVPCPVDASPDDPDYYAPDGCYGLRYEASSLKEWLTKWLDEQLKQYF